DDREARGQPLGAAEELADERPSEVRRDRTDEPAGPALLAAIADRLGQQRVAGMIDVAARISGEHQLLAERGDQAAVPARARKGALRVLALGADDAEAVRLQLDHAPRDRIGDPPAGVDRRQ